MPADDATPHLLDDRLRRSLGEMAATQDPAGDWDALLARHREGAAPLAIGDPHRPPRRGLLAVAAVVLAAVAVAGAALVAARDDGPHDVSTGTTSTTPSSTGPTPSSTTEAATTTSPTTSLPLEVSYEDLPDQGLLVREPDGAVRLLDLDGELLATTASATFVDPDGPVVLVRGTIDDGAPTLAIGQQPARRAAPAGCQQPRGYGLPTSTSFGDVSASVCGTPEDPEAAPREIWITEDGETSVLAGAPPDPSFGGDEVAGSWRDAVPSPDGRWVLGQWSGECESPSAWLVPTDGGDPIPAGSFGLSLDGATVLESGGLGWAPDGRAIVRYTEGICGTGIPGPGVYAVDPDTGEATVLVPDGGDAPSIWLWSKGERTAPQLSPQDIDAARSTVEQLLAELRSGDAAGASRYWIGYPEVGEDAPAGALTDALQAFAEEYAWLLDDPDPTLSVVASVGSAGASPVVTAIVDAPDGGQRAAAFVVGGQEPDRPRRVVRLPSERPATVPAEGTEVDPGQTVVVEGLPVEGGARAYVNGIEVPAVVDHAARTTTITLTDDLVGTAVVTLSRATPEVSEAFAWWFPVRG